MGESKTNNTKEPLFWCIVIVVIVYVYDTIAIHKIYIYKEKYSIVIFIHFYIDIEICNYSSL